MSIDGSRSVDLAELALHRGEAAAHERRLLVGQTLDGALVDRSRGGQAKVGGRLGNVDGEHVKLVGVLHGCASAVVDAHRALGQTVLLLKLGVHEVQRLAELGGAILQCLLKQVAGSLQLLAAVASNKLGQVNVPNLEGHREVEQLDASLVHLIW